MIDVKSFLLVALAGLFFVGCHPKIDRNPKDTYSAETATLSEKWQIGPFNKIDN